MHRHVIALTMLLGAVLVAPAQPVAAQTPSLRDDVVVASRLSSDQVEQVQRFAEYWAAQLADPETAEAARQQLTSMLVSAWQPPSDSFIFEYTRQLVPRLQQVTRNEGAHAAVNALHVAGQLGSGPAIDLLLAEISATDVQRRVAAATGVRVALGTGRVPAAKLNAIVRDLRRAALQESEWIPLLKQLTALEAVNTTDARVARAEAIGAAAGRLVQAEKIDPWMLEQTIYRSIYALRNELLILPLAEQEAVGKSFGPALVRVLDIAVTHWDAAQADAAMKERVTKLVHTTESALGQVDVLVRDQPVPSTKLDQAWAQGDRAAFERGVQAWRDIVDQPPYEPLAAMAGP